MHPETSRETPAAKTVPPPPYVEEACPQTLPSSRLPAVLLPETLPPEAELTLAKELYREVAHLREQVRQLQKGCRKLSRKRKGNAARAERRAAQAAVTLGALAELVEAAKGLRIIDCPQSFRTALAYATDLIAGPL